MPVIKPRTEEAKKLVRHRSLLSHENHQTLLAYASFINEPPDYVVNELIATVLAKDGEFKKWRPTQAEAAAASGRANGKHVGERRASNEGAKTALAATEG
jgi:hypothetical protein